jgi:hypothetical protein
MRNALVASREFVLDRLKWQRKNAPVISKKQYGDETAFYGAFRRVFRHQQVCKGGANSYDNDYALADTRCC